MAWLSLEELKKYDAKEELKKMAKAKQTKAAEKSAPSLRSQGQPVEVVRDTGAKNAISELQAQRRKSQATKKQMKAIGQELRKSGATDFASYQAAAQKQMELQKQLPMASFTAGLLNSMGEDVAKITAKATGNQQLQNAWGRTLDQLEETQEANRGAGMAGAMAGELVKAKGMYDTIGAVAEKVALPVAGKLLGGKALSKGGEIATRLIGQQAADTAVNTPITIAAGMAEGKNRGEIAKDVGKQMAMDAAFNLGLEGLGTVAGVVRAKNAQKKIPQQLEDSMTGNMKPNEYIELGETPEILKRYGMIDGEMRMPQGVVPKTAYPAEYRQALAQGAGISEKQVKKIQGHNLGFEAIRQLPEKMRNPVAILKSDTQKDNLVVLTDMVDRAGRPVIVPIRVDKNGTTDFGTVIPSMYGRKDFADFMKKQEEKGNILYYDKKRNLHQLPNSGVQFPESFNADADPMLRVAQRSEKVNENKATEKVANMKKTDDFVVETPGKAKQVYQDEGFSATTGMKDGKEVTRYTNPALDKNPLEMEGVKELLNDSEFDMMDADATDYSAALGIKPINWTANKDFYRVMEEAGSLDPAAKEMFGKRACSTRENRKRQLCYF